MLITELIDDESFLLSFDRWTCEGQRSLESLDEDIFQTLMSMLYSFSEGRRRAGMADLHEPTRSATAEGGDSNIVGLTLRTAFYGVLSDNLCKARDSLNQGDRKQGQWHLEECMLSGRDLRNPRVIAMAGILVCSLGTTHHNCGSWRELAGACAALGDDAGARFCQREFERQADPASAAPLAPASTSRTAPVLASQYRCAATAVEEIAASLAAELDPRSFRLVLVAGGSCSGKSYFARQLAVALDARGHSANVVSQDWYFRDLTDSRFPRDSRDRPIADVPQAFHLDQLVDTVLSASRGEPMDCPVYDMASNRRVAGQTRRMPPTALYIVEGLHVITELGALRTGSLRVHVTAPDGVRLARRQARDSQYGVSKETVARAWSTRIAPAYALYDQTQQSQADVIVHNHFEAQSGGDS